MNNAFVYFCMLSDNIYESMFTSLAYTLQLLCNVLCVELSFNFLCCFRFFFFKVHCCVCECSQYLPPVSSFILASSCPLPNISAKFCKKVEAWKTTKISKLCENVQPEEEEVSWSGSAEGWIVVWALRLQDSRKSRMKDPMRGIQERALL